MGTLGSYLADAREALGIDLHAAAQQTRISIHYLQALEREDFSRLPGQVFVKGFLKNYARFLNVPEEEVMKRYGEVAGVQQVPAGAPPGAGPAVFAPPEPRRREETPLEPFVWGAVIFIALIVLLFTSLPKRHGEEPATPAQSSEAPAAPTAAPLPGQSGKLSLEISAVEDAWVLVRIDGSPQKKAVLAKGETVTWIADQRFLLSYSRLGAVKLALNGRELAVAGPPSAVVRDLVVTSAGIVNQKIQTEQAVPRPKPVPPAPQPAAPPAPVEAPAVPPPSLPSVPPASPAPPASE